MSVINKMLRDLDQRQDAGPSSITTDAESADQTALRQGTASVMFGESAANQALPRRSWMWAGLGLLAATALAAGVWAWLQNHEARPRADIAVAPTAATPAPASTLVVAPTNATTPNPDVAAPPTPSVIAPAPESTLPDGMTAAAAASGPADKAPGAVMALRMDNSLSARATRDAVPSTPSPTLAPAAMVPPPSPVLASAPVAPARTPVPLPATAVVPVPGVATPEHPRPRPTVAAPISPPTSDNAPAIQRQQQAGGDAMAQAQNLWSSGSRDAAMELMQQSIAAAERSAKAGTSASGGAVLVTLVREMTRMQLAEARFGAVWEMLTRLEPLLGNQPDLWAIRANAAQRLGRHQDSVHAYMMALQSRPEEQRWLLGTAVSLAALGQTSSAAEMAEKARAAGPVSKEILAYLRQAGVSLKD